VSRSWALWVVLDGTEVTREQYAAWPATNPSTAGQPSQCSFNTSFQPNVRCLNSPYVCNGSTCAKEPQVCVDWCDAYAYCKAVRQRLCRKLGGGANAFADCANAALNPWYDACVSDGTNNAFPYGNTLVGSACNGWEASVGTTIPVGSKATCQSSVAGCQGVYGLSGNVYEWEGSCDVPAHKCRLRGGSFFQFDTALRCNADASEVRTVPYADMGLRRCSP
jgi:formylglycine-generating enzyme required for sulfatase activity